MTEPRVQTVSVITVTFNSAHLVLRALESAERAAQEANVGLELIVVDNASSDRSADVVAERYPEAIIIRNPRNLGFGVANNQAFERASGDVWMLLNPDAILDTAALWRLTDFLRKHPSAAAVGPSVYTPGTGGAESCGMSLGLASAMGHYLFLNRLLWGDMGGPWRGFQLRRRPHLGPRRVDWISGAAAALRPAPVRAVGGFDPTLFLYCEDVDLGERLRLAGWELWLVPGARATHLIAGSQGQVSTRWLDAIYDLYARRAGRLRLAGLQLILALGLSVRALVFSARRSSAAQLLQGRRMRASAARSVVLLARAIVGCRP